MSDLNFSLLPWQQEVFADKTRFKVIAAGRRCGKSRLSAITLLIEGLQCSAGSAVLYVAPTNGQARQIIWDVLMELGREVIQASHINNMDITLINGAKIYVRGADRPDTLRGVSLTYAVLDEVADIKPEAWEQVILCQTRRVGLCSSALPRVAISSMTSLNLECQKKIQTGKAGISLPKTTL
jgi:phage terminase large subunit-like protein